MKQCNKCKWNYPDHLLHPIVDNNGPSAPVGGICALQITNEVHGINRRRFDGELAEAGRQGALSWRGNHPEHAPGVNN